MCAWGGGAGFACTVWCTRCLEQVTKLSYVCLASVGTHLDIKKPVRFTPTYWTCLPASVCTYVANFQQALHQLLILLRVNTCMLLFCGVCTGACNQYVSTACLDQNCALLWGLRDLKHVDETQSQEQNKNETKQSHNESLDYKRSECLCSVRHSCHHGVSPPVSQL